QLAALYSSTSTLLPEPREGKTGTEVAARLVRQCAIDRPLSEGESAQLHNLVAMARFEPVVVLLCQHLEMSAFRLTFLHDKTVMRESKGDECAWKSLSADAYRDAGCTYMAQKRSLPSGVHLLLTAAEEQRLFGMAAQGWLAASSLVPKLGTGISVAKLI